MISTASAITEVFLSTKERNALQLLGVSTVGEFLEVDLRRVFSLRGFGATTYANLKDSRDTLREEMFPQSLEAHGGDPFLYDEDDISTLGLTVRGLKALRRLKVGTIREFLRLDLAHVGHLHNCGEVTRRHLTETQARLRECVGFSEDTSVATENPVETPQNGAMRDFVGQPASVYSWRKLPLFSGRAIPGIKATDLHESYLPNTPVERLVLTGRVKRAIAGKGIKSLGEMLLTPGPDLIGHNYCGSVTLASIQSLVDSFLNDSMLAPPPPPELDTTSPDRFLTSLLTPVISDERQRRVLLERMGCQSAPRTLKEIAEQLGLTRERVRQIEKAGLKKLFHWRAAHSLEPLHDLIAGMLRDIAPVMSLAGICRALQLLYGWQAPIHKDAILRFLPVFSDLKCIDGRYLCLRSFRCIDCPSLPNILDTTLDGIHEKTIGLPALARQLRAQMLKSEDCRRCGNCPTRASVSLVRLVFSGSATAPKRFRIVKNELWAREHWRIAKGPLSAALESILKDHVGPMTYQELHAAANHTRQDDLTPEMVWHALSTTVHNGADILLWDRGGVYQHKSHVNLYTPILNTVEKWVIQALCEGPFPQLSANAPFQVLRDECVAAGLTSEYAIHSCLKHRGHPKLVFLKSPYIALAGIAKYRIPNLEILEELVRQEGDVVGYETLHTVACERMGLKEFQLGQIINQWEDVIRTEKGFLHVDYFDANSPAFISLVEYVKQRLAREGQVSAELIFSEKRVSCLGLRIDGARMLHSVLARFAGESIAWRMYPLLTLATATDATERDTIRHRIVAYVRAKQQPVSCGELFGFKIYIFTHRDWPNPKTLPTDKAVRKDLKRRWRSTVWFARVTLPGLRWLRRRAIRRVTKQWLKAQGIKTYSHLIVERGNVDMADPTVATKNRFIIAQKKQIRMFVEDDLAKAVKLAGICDIVFLLAHGYNEVDAGSLPANVIRLSSWDDIFRFIRDNL